MYFLQNTLQLVSEKSTSVVNCDEYTNHATLNIQFEFLVKLFSPFQRKKSRLRSLISQGFSFLTKPAESILSLPLESRRREGESKGLRVDCLCHLPAPNPRSLPLLPRPNIRANPFLPVTCHPRTSDPPSTMLPL